MRFYALVSQLPSLHSMARLQHKLQPIWLRLYEWIGTDPSSVWEKKLIISTDVMMVNQ